MATTDQSIRSYLDSLGQLPGCILYRNTIAWEALPPGQAGQLLTLDAAGLPAWTDRGAYFPALMQYDGTSTWYSHTTLNLQNQPWAMPFRFSFKNPTTFHRIWVTFANGFQWNDIFCNPDGTIQVTQRDDTSTLCMRLRSVQPYDDGEPHYGWAKYNPALGTAEFLIDGQNVDWLTWPDRILTSGTLRTDTTSEVYVGRFPAADRFWPGTIGAIGFKNNALPNWQDFMDASGWPKPIDHDTWTQWVGQPPVWHESGALQWNRGSAGAFTPSGNLTLADPLDWN